MMIFLRRIRSRVPMLPVDIDKEDAIFRKIADQIAKAASRLGQMLHNAHAQNHVEHAHMFVIVHEIGKDETGRSERPRPGSLAGDGKRHRTDVRSNKPGVRKRLGSFYQTMAGAGAGVQDGLAREIVTRFHLKIFRRL